MLNDTRVVAARLIGHKSSGGRVEILLERVADVREALAQLSASKPIRAGLEIATAGGTVRVIAREGEFWRIAVPEPVLEFFERVGEVPLPPYIRRPPVSSDRERYQSIFAREPGAIAAGALFGPSSMLAWQDWQHLNIALGTIFLPMTLEAAVRLRRRPGARQGVILGAVLGASLLVNQESAVMAVLLAGAALLPWLVRHPAADRLRTLGWGAPIRPRRWRLARRAATPLRPRRARRPNSASIPSTVNSRLAKARSTTASTVPGRLTAARSTSVRSGSVHGMLLRVTTCPG